MIIAQLDFWINTLPPPTRERHYEALSPPPPNRERHYDALRTKIDMWLTPKG